MKWKLFHIRIIIRITTWKQCDESVGIAVKLCIETKIGLYIHYIYSHTTNLNAQEVKYKNVKKENAHKLNLANLSSSREIVCEIV